jgi:predicted TPR repeat methyltransferase
MSAEGLDEERRPSVCLRVRSSVLMSPSTDGYLAYDVETQAVHHLNPIAALVLELCDGTRDLTGLRGVLLPVVGERSWAACDAWIHEALESGLLASDPESTTDLPAMSASALTNMATTLRDNRQVLPAFICQQHATNLEPDDPEMWYRLGELAHLARRRDDARAAYARYFTAHPEDAAVEYLLHALTGTIPARAPDRYIEQVFTRFAPSYDEWMMDALEYRGPALLVDAVAAAVGNGRQLAILDLGCGTGLMGCVLRPLARRLDGVDLAAPMIERARDRGIYDALHHAEITRFLASAAPDAFDVIAACDSLVYFGDLRQVVTLAAARLAPGGVLAFTVERGETPSFQITDSGRFVHHRDYLVHVIGEAGLEVVNLTDAVLRLEYGEAVWGLVTTARRSGMLTSALHEGHAYT